MLTMVATSFVTIENLYINGNLTSAAGILAQGTQSLQVRNNYFARFTNGNAAICSGGTLYTDLKDNTFDSSIAGYAIDFQNSYSNAPASTYYGINVGTMEIECMPVWGCVSAGSLPSKTMTSRLFKTLPPWLHWISANVKLSEMWS